MKKMILVMGVILVLLTGFRISWILHYKMDDEHQAKNGVIDLSGTNLNEKEVVPLDGEWQFYPNRRISDDSNSSASPSEQHFAKVPSTWEHLSGIDTDLHYGTYYLKIKLPTNTDIENLYGIRLKDIYSAATLYVEGKKVLEIGSTSASEENYVSKSGIYKTTFPASGNEINVAIQVANFEDFHHGGIPYSVHFGSSEAINKQVYLSRTLQLVTVAILIFHSIYAFALFFANKRSRKKEILFFGILLIFSALSILVDEDKLLIQPLSIDSIWAHKLLYFTFAGVLYSILKFIKYIFHLEGFLFRVLFTLYPILAISLFILPDVAIPYIGNSIMFLNITSYTYIFIVVFTLLKQGNADAFYILIANGINLINVLWGVAINLDLIGFPFYPVDYLVSILVMAGLLINRYVRMVRINKQQKEELEDLDKKKDKFLANTSHELRNPLHGIINIAQSILQDKSEQLSSENKSNLSLLIRIGQQMEFTLNDLLDISRLKEKHVHLTKEPIKLASLVSGVIDIIYFLTEEKNLEIKNNIKESFPLVYGDKNRLIQILFNLLHNAVKYTDDGIIKIEATSHKGWATISVTDTGKGISEHQKESIFQPYVQGNSKQSDTNDGFGLGLSISRQLIELHGGTIHVASTLEKGSTFQFTLPLSIISSTGSTVHTETDKSLQSTMEQRRTPSNVRTRSSNILIVDDDPVNLNVLNRLLGQTYYVSTASNGRDALKQLPNKQWDLVISGTMMPEMSGYGLTRAIRKYYSVAELPILLLTARHKTEDIHTAFDAGANDYVAKPVDALELTSRVNSLIDLRVSIQEQLRLEAAWLQAQIRPHFLFNTLNTIASLSEIDTNRMSKLLSHFGNYLRRSFDLKNVETVIPFHGELEIVKSYVYIEQERFGERLNIQWDVEHNAEFKLPPLSIQPLVENAIHHGILPLPEGGTVRITISIQDSFATISVEDDGIGMNQEKVDELLHNKACSSGGIGIANTNKRLQKLYGKGLQIRSKLHEGSHIQFTVPIK